MKSTLYLLLLLCLPVLATAQTIRYVKQTPSGNGSGSSWANASNDLQGMINATGVQQVWVAAGTYKPTTGTARTSSFSMKNGVAIYGGFAGNETSLSQRTASYAALGVPSSSTLSGDIDNDGTLANNSYHVIFNNNNGLTSSAVLDGFVITGGNANGGTSVTEHGGGIYNYQSSPRIVNCSLSGNSAFSVGGAIYNDNSNSTLTNCGLSNNSTINNCGAIYNGNSSPMLTNCSFIGNTAGNNGGAMFNYSSSSPVLINCSFISNTAGNNGGAIINFDSNPTLINCSLSGNNAGNNGGTIINNASNPTLTNCVLWSNGGSRIITNSGNSSMTVNYSLFDASATGYSGTNNLTTNTSPFVSGNSAALVTGSAAINAGNTASYLVAGGTTTDLLGNARFVGGTCAIDMGAIEVQSGSAYIPVTVGLPVSASVSCAGSTVTLPASVSGTGPLTYQWYKDGASLGAAQSSSTLGLSNVQVANSGSYSLVVTGTCNSLTSTAFSLSVSTPATRLYVAASQTANVGDGLSWATAFPDLQSALTYPCSQSLTEIWVAAGTYKPTSTTARDVSFAMLPGVAIYGGFVGTETSLSQRPVINPTANRPSSSTLSGEIGNPSSTTDNSYHVMFNPQGLTSSAVLDGFVITGGNANGDNNPHSPLSQGGGIYLNNSSPTIRNCSLKDNQSATYGGGIYIEGNISYILDNILIINNTAAEGGGLFSQGGTTGTIRNSRFVSNTGSRGGGVSFFTYSSILALNTTFESNTAVGLGGAIFNGGGITLVNCTILTNSSRNNSPGRAISNSGANATLINTIVWGNGGSNTFLNSFGAQIIARYSLFDNGVTGVTADPTNITGVTASPFISANSAQLSSCAPAIGSADPTTTTSTVGTTDLAGNARFTNGRLDMGAYQYQDAVADQVRAITVQPIAGTVVCAGTSVAVPVSATGLGTSFSYQWYKDNTLGVPVSLGSAQSTSVLSLPTATTVDAGTYRVVVSTDCNSLTSTTFSLTVNAPPPPMLSVAPSATLTCAQTSLTLTANATGNGLTYAFQGPSGSLVGNANSLTINVPGTYTVLVTNANGCTATSTTAISQDIVPPTPSLTTSTGSQTFCANASLTLVAGGGSSYQFSSGATQLGGSTSNMATVSTAGTYSVVVTGSNGCTATASVSVSTVALTTLTSVPPTSVSVCETGAVSLSVGVSGANLRYQWYKNSALLGGQTMSTLSILSASNTDNGSYYVTVTGVCGTTSTNPTTLSVRSRPAAPTLATSSVTAVVSLTPLPLTPFLVAMGNTLSFSGVSGLLNPAVADISMAGVQNFSVTATDPYGCVSVSTPFSLTVYLPFPPASQSVCRGSNVVMSVLPTAVRYQWYRVNGTALLRLTEVAGVQRGTGTASLTLLSVQTSASYVCQATQANGSVVSYGPFAAVVTLCGGREAAVEPTLAVVVVVAPNPLAGGWLRAVVRGAGGERLRLALYDQQGRLWRQEVIEQGADEERVEWPVGDVPVGTLLLRATTDRHSQTIKVIHD